MSIRTVFLVTLTLVFALTPLSVAQKSIAGPDGQQSVSEAQHQAGGPWLVSENTYVNKSCSGEPSVPYPQVYVFGLRDDQGGCSTRTYKANSFEEAYSCAVKSCPNCQIEDLTWLNRFSSSTEGVDPIRGYCPSHKQ